MHSTWDWARRRPLPSRKRAAGSCSSDDAEAMQVVFQHCAKAGSSLLALRGGQPGGVEPRCRDAHRLGRAAAQRPQEKSPAGYRRRLAAMSADLGKITLFSGLPAAELRALVERPRCARCPPRAWCSGRRSGRRALPHPARQGEGLPARRERQGVRRRSAQRRAVRRRDDARRQPALGERHHRRGFRVRRAVARRLKRCSASIPKSPCISSAT